MGKQLFLKKKIKVTSLVTADIWLYRLDDTYHIAVDFRHKNKLFKKDLKALYTKYPATFIKNPLVVWDTIEMETDRQHHARLIVCGRPIIPSVFEPKKRKSLNTCITFPEFELEVFNWLAELGGAVQQLDILQEIEENIFNI